jgi:purine-cytosine permease-like protein
MADETRAEVAPESGNFISAESHVPAGQGRDVIAQLETRGIDYIPAVERNSRPLNLAWTYFGAQFGYAVYVLGGLLPAFGLGWWASFWAIICGTLIGSLAVASVALIGPKTGTNSTVSSVASFGVHGRYLGCVIAQFDNLGFNVIIIWAGGLALVQALYRLAGTSDGTGALIIGMAIVAIVMSVLGLLGHATLIVSFKFVAITNVILMVVFILITHSHFHTHPVGTPYLLGSFWPTWLLGLTLGIVSPISYGVGVNDYARRIPENASPRNIFAALAGGMFAGNALAYLMGAWITLCFASVATPLVTGFVQLSPGWFLVPFIVLGFFGNIVGGGLDMYNATLDLHAILFKISRAANCLIIIVVTFIVTYFAVVVFNAVTTVTSFATVLSAVLGPWIAILIVRHFELRGRYNVLDLHAYASGEHGVYWYWNGFGLRAVAVWAISTAIGLLWSSTTLYEGPLASMTDDIDLSFISAFIIGGVAYYVTGKMMSPSEADPLSRTCTRRATGPPG